MNKSLIIFAWLFWSGISLAGDYSIKADEVRLLPPYCKSLTPKHFTPAAQKLLAGARKPPSGFSNIHHFCHGLKYLIRARRTFGDEGRKDYRLKQAIGEFDYVIGAKRPGSKMYQAYVRVNRAKAYEMKDDLGASLRDLADAIRMAPKFPYSYARMSDLYLKMGNHEDARKVLHQGLKSAPKSKMLRRRWQKLEKLQSQSLSGDSK
ncbi:MAG: tetratricopeptide repeat protein [Methylohalobius sp. ZOD2]